MVTFRGALGIWELPHVHRWQDRALALRVAADSVVGPETRIATIGSCFAEELARSMDRLGLTGAMHPGGLFYSSRTVRQEFERIFAAAPALAEEPLWQVEEGWIHPFKDYKHAFPTRDALQAWSDRLDRLADELFRCAEVIVITLGLVETWRHPIRPVTYRQIPHPGVFHDLDPTFHRLTTAEILDDLIRIHELVRSHSGASLILTVSPVPLHATFTPHDVRVANTESKSRIRAAVSEFVDAHPDAFYFPSYEIVTTAERPSDFMLEDGRHVSRPGVDYILAEFLRQFGTAAAMPPARDTSWIAAPDKTAATPRRPTKLPASPRAVAGRLFRWVRRRTP